MNEITKETATGLSVQWENGLTAIEESRLPEVLQERITLLEEANSAYEYAKTKEAEAKEAADKAAENAEKLLNLAKESGKAEVGTHSIKFFWKEFKWSTSEDKFEAINQNLQSLVTYGIKSAEAQQELATVQAAFSLSQEALLNVQEKQMRYQEQIADATKFLYGLSAYNMAASQSVLINLKAVLEGASKEKLGEMATQQLLMAMDQLKNQENIVKRLKANEGDISAQGKRINSIEQIDVIQNAALAAQSQKNEVQDDELARQAEKDVEHDRRLDEQAEKDIEHDRRLDEQVAKDAEHDKRLEDQAAKDREHDALLAQQAEKDIEHDKLLAQQIEKDEEHDRLFAQQKLKDAEHDRLLAQQAEKDLEHDEQLAHQVERDLEHDSRLNEQAEKDVEHDRRLAELEKRADFHDTSLAEHGDSIAGNADTIKEQASMIAQLNEEIANLKLALDTKASKKSDLISLILAGLSLLGVIVHFCI